MSELNAGKLRATSGVVFPTFDNSNRPSSPEIGQTIFNSEEENAQLWDGSEWIDLGSGGRKDGSSPDKAALSAAAILLEVPGAPDGVYWIDIPQIGPTQVYCIMNTAYDGGGWMMAMKATRGSTFTYFSNYWTDNTTTLNPSQANINDGDAKFQTFNNFAARDLLAIWPDLNPNSGCISVSRGHVWLQNAFNGGVRTTLPSFFNTVDELFIGDAAQFCGVGQFSQQKDVRFYGFNYKAEGSRAADSRCRWGFGWNENGGGLYPNANETSPDVAGGIGMIHRGGAQYSAGDYIGCCQNVTGFNRTARVEVYVR